ncbi:hypothetical protein SCAR479_02053 [Seiridium cardinale]|uniref:Uncharacterized protein n=1 Tax=Seiridium cardinale TaxID=138064 RepID=A0ABR2Y4I5_9PEZI
MVAFELVVAHLPAGHNVAMTRAAQTAIRGVASVTITKSMATSIVSAPDSTMANFDATAQQHVGVKIFNGFATNNTTADSALRLFLVLSYDYTVQDGKTTERMGFHTFEGTLMGGLTFKQMGEDVFDVTNPDVYAISCHNLIMKEEFDERAKPTRWKTPGLIKIDSMMRETPNVWLQALLGRIQPGSRLFKEHDRFRSVCTQQVKPYLDSEVEVFEKTAEASLDRTLASVAGILGECLAPGLASWTSVKTTDATNAQLGSYALLLAIITGLLALASSASHASTNIFSMRRRKHILKAVPFGTSTIRRCYRDDEDAMGGDEP